MSPREEAKYWLSIYIILLNEVKEYALGIKRKHWHFI